MTRFQAWSDFKLSLILFAFLSTTVSPAQQRRHPCSYLIPREFVGWVTVDYQIKDAPALPTKDGYRVFKFPTTGRLQTSSAFEVGTYSDLEDGLKDKYYYYDADSLRPLPAGPLWSDGGMIWHHGWGEEGGTIRGAVKKVSYEYFFVGKAEEYQEYGAGSIDRVGRPKVGPVDKHAPQNKE